MTGYVSSASFARPNNTTAYAANDVLGTAEALSTPLVFAGIGPGEGGEVLITSAALKIDASSVPSGMTNFLLHLYSVMPPSALGDNAPWDLPSGDRASYQGYIDLGTPVNLGSTLYAQTDFCPPRQITVPIGGAMYGYLVTIGAYTPTALTVKSIKLHSIGV